VQEKLWLKSIREGKLSPSRLYICEELSTQKTYETHILAREREHQATAAAHACYSGALYISTYLKHHFWIALELNCIIKL